MTDLTPCLTLSLTSSSFYAIIKSYSLCFSCRFCSSEISSTTTTGYSSSFRFGLDLLFFLANLFVVVVPEPLYAAAEAAAAAVGDIIVFFTGCYYCCFIGVFAILFVLLPAEELLLLVLF